MTSTTRAGLVTALLLGVAFVTPPPAPAAPEQYHLIGAPEVYTLVNLHPDEGRRRLYSVNYQQSGMLPRCTRVAIKSVNKKEMKFRLADSDREYTWLFHDSLRDSIERHLDKYFGRTCDADKPKRLSKLDQEGIAEGRALVGMSREGVILAIGYPPEHATPNMDANGWKYWKNKFGTMLVEFENGKVSRIK
jgi:hypothetical protein